MEGESQVMDSQQAPADSGQGDTGEAATPQYGEYNTPDELYAAYQAQKEQYAALNDKVVNLESLKGRMGNELGTIRQQYAQTQGMLRALQQQREAQEAKQYDTSQIYARLRAGDIDEAAALQEMEGILRKQFGQEVGKVKQTYEQFQKELRVKEYVSDFVSKNPGYKEAYEGGALNKWLQNGMPGEEAWLHYKIEQAEVKAQALEKQLASTKTTAEQAGLQKGVQLEKGKTATARVLGDGGGGRLKTEPASFVSKAQRNLAGVQLLERLRSRG